MLRYFFPRMGRRPTGEDDATAAQLRDLERQGAHLAGLAHVCAGALVVLFSLGSLISLSADALNAVLLSWHRGALDVPAAISVAVSTLLVLAMDTAMLYAASVLRVLATRGAGSDEAAVHRAVMISAALLEAATYTYMSWQYDRPATLAAWAIILARALAAPLYAVYLSMARPLPVGPRDIFAQAELAAGRGVLRDVTALANDAGASLDKKLRMYGAASVMPDRERTRLTDLIAAVSEPDRAPLALPAPALAPALALASERADTLDDVGVDLDAKTPDDPDPTPPAGPTPGGPRGRRRPNVPTPSTREDAPRRGPVVLLTSDKPRRIDSGRRSAEAHARWMREADAAADLLTADPLMTTRALARALGIRPERATDIRRAVQPVRPTRADVEADRALAARQAEGQASA